MKKYLLTIIFTFLLANIIFASDLSSQINNARCVTEYGDNAAVDDFDTVMFGSYPQNSAGAKEPIEWIVLDKQDDKALLVSKYILDQVEYNKIANNPNLTWNDSYIRKWLNTAFIDSAFSNEEKDKIISTYLENYQHEWVDTGVYYDEESEPYLIIGAPDNVKIFLLSFNDIDYYLYTESRRNTRCTNYSKPDSKSSYYMLRDIIDAKIFSVDAVQYEKSRSACLAVSVSKNGKISEVLFGDGRKAGVRPAMWVSYDTNDNGLNNDIHDNDVDIIDDDFQVDGNGVMILKNGWANERDLIVYYVNGNKARGWTEISGDWYFFGGPDDHLLTNDWIGANGRSDDPNQYYVGADGKMLKNTTTPDGYQVDASGKKIIASTTMSGYFKVNEDTRVRYPGQMFMSVKKDDVLEVVRVEGDNAIIKNERNDVEGTLSIKYLGEKVGDLEDTIDENKNKNNNSNIDNDNLLNTSTVWKKIDEFKEEENRLKNAVYYYAKQESKNEPIYDSIKKTSKKDGWFGTGLFSKTNKTYYSIDVKLNKETTKRLSKYADFGDSTFLNLYQWILLFGNDINKLEYGCSISPHSDNESLALTEGLTYYQKGMIYIKTNTKKEQDSLYNKIKNSYYLIISTNNVVKSHNVEYNEEEMLGGFTRFERQKPIEGLNWVTGYVDCEDKIIDYSKNHIGYTIYAKDGYDGSIVYMEDIEVPITSCKLFNIFTFGQDSSEYAMYANHVNFLGKNTSAAMNQFAVFGGKIKYTYDLDLSKGFKDFEIFYNSRNKE